MNTSDGGDEPGVPQDPHQDEQRDSSAVDPSGYYQNFSKYMASRTVVRSTRAYDYVDDVVHAWKLPDMTNTYDLVTPLSEGNDGDVYYMLDQEKPYVLKIYKSGVNRRYSQFQLDLLKHMDNPEAKAHPGYAAVYFAALPVGWAAHMGKKGLVFRYVVQPRKARKPTANDRAQVRDQIDFLHWLGYVHLDITDRNIMLADKDKCYLMDYDCVCKIGDVPLGPLPSECTETLLTRRFPADLDDDDHLWQHLQTTFFKDLPPDEATLVPMQQQISAKPVEEKVARAARWSPDKKWRTVSVDPSGTVATRSGGFFESTYGYVQTSESVSKGVHSWKVKVIKKPAYRWLFIGVSAPGIQPSGIGWTGGDSSAYGMGSSGQVRAAGQKIVTNYTELPASSVIQADLLKQRGGCDAVFRAGDEVVVVLDCTAHTLRLQSPTVQHVIEIQQQHHQQEWVLNVNFQWGEYQITLG